MLVMAIYRMATHKTVILYFRFLGMRSLNTEEGAVIRRYFI